MTGDKSFRRLVKFWWVLFATVGAAGGAIIVSFCGLANTIWGILGVGLPLGAALGVIEWRADRRPAAVRKVWPETKNHQPPPRRSFGYKPPPRRGQLHAITRRKTAEPPSSGGT
jgi:hypothetical protein